MFEGVALDAAPSAWADLGCGDGTFTRALADRLAAGSIIHAIDWDTSAVATLPPDAGGVRIQPYVGDFTRPWPFALPLDGILMANSLHYVERQDDFLRSCAAALTPAGRLLIVEYDTDAPNTWVPYPISCTALSQALADAGWRRVRLLASRRSRYRRAQLYAALAER